MQKKLLYLHNRSFAPAQTGYMNVTLLQVFSMCNAFARLGLDVKLYMEGDQATADQIDAFKNTAFKDQLDFEVGFWSRVHKNGLINRILLRSKIKEIIKHEQPDIVFTRASAFLKPIVQTATPVIYESHNARQHNRYLLLHKYFQRQVVSASYKNNFLCLLSISDALKEYWKTTGAMEDKLFSWHDGFDESHFKTPKGKTKAREQLNLPQEKTIVTYTGGLYPKREIDKVILLAKEYPEILFMVIGGPEKNKLHYENMAKSMSVANIRFLGYKKHNDIPDYLFASDVLLALWSKHVPTINYCSPLKLFEYMAAGRVILAHGFPTIKEVLTDQHDAIICEPDNFDDLKHSLPLAIEKAQTNVLGLNAREKALSQYTWDKRAASVLGFINNHSAI